MQLPEIVHRLLLVSRLTGSLIHVVCNVFIAGDQSYPKTIFATLPVAKSPATKR